MLYLRKVNKESVVPIFFRERSLYFVFVYSVCSVPYLFFFFKSCSDLGCFSLCLPNTYLYCVYLCICQHLCSYLMYDVKFYYKC